MLGYALPRLRILCLIMFIYFEYFLFQCLECDFHIYVNNTIKNPGILSI